MSQPGVKDEGLGAADTQQIPAPGSTPARETLDARRVAREPPRSLGRYILLDPLGKGGMGAVYGAWDRELQRRVAIKILHSDDDQDRFLREAQALARLHHPNVVTVHDVGSAEGMGFIAMELVQGRTLRQWLQTPRSWREVLAAFRQAGRGLAAAHAAGLVHRDFKPDNVLVADDGVVRVADFGLARVAEVAGAGPTLQGPPAVAKAASMLDAALTGTGDQLGTPRYMAPEQRAGLRTDRAGDQYSFCLALWEALYGRQPGERESFTPPALGRVPSWLRAAVQRGLAEDPGKRWPSLDELMAALARDRSRLVTWGAVGLATVALAVGAAAALATRAPSGERPCAGAAQRLAGVWDGAARERTRAAFLASGRSYAEETFTHVAAILDERAAGWVAMRSQACEATFVRREQSAQLLDLRMECLDQRLGELRALTHLFGGADAELVDHAVSAVHRLGDLGPCANTRTLTEAFPPPADPFVAAQVAALRQRLQQADALNKAGRYPVAALLLGGIVAEARAVGYEPLLGAALHLLGDVQLVLYDEKHAEATLGEAMAVLARVKDDRGLAKAWVDMVNVVGFGEKRLVDALAMRPAAELAIARAGDDGRLTATLDRTIGQILKMQGKLDQALAHHRRALARQQQLDPLDPEIALGHNSIGTVLMAQGNYDEALAELELAYGGLTRAFGADHPFVAGVLINLSKAYLARGRDGEAVQVLTHALAIQEKTIGPEHPDVARTLLNLCAARMSLDDLPAARRDCERSLAIREKRLPAEHVDVATSLSNLGEILYRLGEPERALPLLERALAIRQKLLGMSHPATAQSFSNLASALVVVGRRPEAHLAFERALAIERQQDGGENSDAAATLRAFGELLLGEGKTTEARRLTEQALALREKLGGPRHPDVAHALVSVARVELATGRAAAAVPLLERALTIYAEHGNPPLATAQAKAELERARGAGKPPPLRR